MVSKTIDTEGCGSRQRCRIAAVLRRKGRKKSSQVKFPFFRCFYWRFSDIVLNSVDREGQKNIGVCVSVQRKPLLFQHPYLSYVLFHVFTLSPKDGRAAAHYGKYPYCMSSESTALYIGITSLSKYFAEPCVLPLKTADFCRRHKERAPSKLFTCCALLKLCRRLPSVRLFSFQAAYRRHRPFTTAWVLFFCSVQREFLTLCRRTLASGQLKPRIGIRHLVLAVGQCLGFEIDRECPTGQRKTEFIRCAGKPQLSAAVLTEGIDAALVGHCKAAVDALVMRAALGAAAASAQQHNARYEQHRRKAAGGKKERPSPLLLLDRRAAQLTPAEHFRLGHGSFLRRYSVILHYFTLLYFDILTLSRKSNSIGRPVPMGVSSYHRHISPVSVTPGLDIRKRKNLSVAARFKWSRDTFPSPFGWGYTDRIWVSLAAFRSNSCISDSK